MASLKRAARFFRGAQALNPSERAALARICAEMEAEAASLPGPVDVATMLPPSMPVWRRRIPGTERWLYYQIQEGVVILAAVGGLV